MKTKREEKNRQKYGAQSWQVAITPSSAAAALNTEGATIKVVAGWNTAVTDQTIKRNNYRVKSKNNF
jgi:hypothetical protein